MRDRSEVWGVGLDEDEVIGDDREGLAQRIVVLEGDDAGEGHVPALLGAGLCHRGIAAEAVEDHCVRGTLVGEDGHDIVVRIAIVDDEGLVEGPGEIDVPAE